MIIQYPWLQPLPGVFEVSCRRSVGSTRLQTDEAYIGYVLSVLLCGEDVLAVGVALKRGVDLKKTIPQLRDNQAPPASLDAAAGPTRRVYIERVNE